jgi:protein involved in polysaccharide export with SLBB domain
LGGIAGPTVTRTKWIFLPRGERRIRFAFWSAPRERDDAPMTRAGFVCSGLLAFTVFGEEKLSGDYELDQSGQISLHLAGTVQALGLTQSELEQALSNKFRSQYLKNPKVTVTIATLRPFYVMGDVTKPGEYPYKSGLTAMALAGGPTYRANRTTVQIQRLGETSMREYPISASVPILPGDVIRVPERYF